MPIVVLPFSLSPTAVLSLIAKLFPPSNYVGHPVFRLKHGFNPRQRECVMNNHLARHHHKHRNSRRR